MNGRILTLATIAATALASPAFGAGMTPVYELVETFRGDEGNDLRWPVAIAEAPGGAILVADGLGSRVIRFELVDAAWKPVRTAELPAAPMDLVSDGTGVWISLRGDAGLYTLDDQLRLRSVALPRGTVPGAMVALEEGGALIQDLADGEILRLSASGAVDVFAKPGATFTALAERPGGGFLGADPVSGRILRYDGAGNEIDRWAVPGMAPERAWPSDLVGLPGGRLAVVDRHGDRIVVLDGSGQPFGFGGRSGWEPGLLRFPSSATLLGQDRLAVADQLNGRIQIYRWLEPTP